MRADLDASCRAALREGAAPLEGGQTVVASSTPGPADPSPCVTLARWLEDEGRGVTADLSFEVTAPSCTRSRDAFASCVSRCELRYRPEDIEVAVDAEGALSAPQASPRCRASCETLSAVAAECTGSEVALRVADPGGVADSARLSRLRALWEGHGPAIADLTARAERVSRAASRLVSIAPVLPEAAATVSIRAVACASAAAGDVSAASARLQSVASDGGAVLRPQLR